MRVDAAGLRAGTGVASISTADSLVMNATINSLLGGGNIGLTAAHYDALASADANAGAVLDALALDLGFTGGTYGEIGRAHVRTPVTNAHLVCRLLFDKKKHTPHRTSNKPHVNRTHRLKQIAKSNQ